jgi:hypothetical protein
LLLLLGLAGVLAVAARVLMKPAAVTEKDCQGGEQPTVTWQAKTAVPVTRSKYLNAIHPELTAHVPIAIVTHRGNRVYATKCDSEYGHNHQPVIDIGHAKEANAYFHKPSRAVGDGEFEVSTVLAVARTAAMPRALRDRHFPEGQALMVYHLVKGAPAELGGLRVNDLLTSVDGQAVPPDPDALMVVLGNGPETMTFDVIRDGQPQTVRLTRKQGQRFGLHAMAAPVSDAER